MKTMKITQMAVGVLGLAAMLFASGTLLAQTQLITSGFGAPLRNLPADLLAAFTDGLAEFEEEDTLAQGLGPIFNNVSCAACHSSPATGGASAILETRFGRLVDGHFDPMTELGGSLLQESSLDPACQEIIPDTATIIARRQTQPLFGLGLIEAIPDLEIIANALLSKPDGVVGRVAIVKDVATGQFRVGRFGWKAQQATLLAFSGDAYLNEMGVTSRLFPQENAPNGDTTLLAQFDQVADPEDEVDPTTGKGNIDAFTEFMKFLAPPPRLSTTLSTLAGAAVFGSIGCAYCHLPVFYTGPSSIEALDQQAVALYSDLLLHDMGSLGDGIAQAAAGQREMRTAPLWGLRASAPYLHDGRAATVDEAIRAHDGEGATARDRYVQLTSTYQKYLLDFLNSN